MTLLKTARQVMNFARNPSKLVSLIWDEFTALDGRIDDVEAGTVAEGSIDTAELADGAVETDKIADDAVDSDKLAIFNSTEQTGDGTAQSIAHGLGVEPAIVRITFSSIPEGGATYTYTKGSTNVNVTATTGAKYFVVAIA
jgi:hypothetical protein